MRSLAKGAVTNLNVRWNERTYVLELQDSPTPLLSVIFQQQPPGRTEPRLRPVTPSRLLGLLDTVKAFPMLRESHPEAVQGVDAMSFAAQPKVMDYGDFEIRLEEAFRFDAPDTLVFRVTMRNKTDRELRYRSDSFSLRAGDSVPFGRFMRAVLPSMSAFLPHMPATLRPMCAQFPPVSAALQRVQITLRDMSAARFPL